MKSFVKEYLIDAPLDSVWQCLVDEKLMKEWGAGPANFEARIGSKFNMWGDYLEGQVTDMKENELLVEDWTVEGMQEPSKVEFALSSANNKTKLVLTHSNVPDELADELNQGWDDHYLGAIQEYLEK